MKRTCFDKFWSVYILIWPTSDDQTIIGLASHLLHLRKIFFPLIAVLLQIYQIFDCVLFLTVQKSVQGQPFVVKSNLKLLCMHFVL